MQNGESRGTDTKCRSEDVKFATASAVGSESAQAEGK